MGWLVTFCFCVVETFMVCLKSRKQLGEIGGVGVYGILL